MLYNTLPKQVPLFSFIKDEGQTKLCKSCLQHFPESLEFFYSAGKNKTSGRQYYKSVCIECDKKRNKLRQAGVKPPALPDKVENIQAPTFITVEMAYDNAQRALTAYLRVRQFIKEGIVKSVDLRQMRLKQWLEAERSYRRVLESAVAIQYNLIER